MKSFINKFFNKKKHNQIKIEQKKKKDIEIFKSKYEKYINGIQKVLKDKKEIIVKIAKSNT